MGRDDRRIARARGRVAAAHRRGRVDGPSARDRRARPPAIYQHFNLRWSRARLTGVLDWGEACIAPPELDVGHCRLNLAVLFSAEIAERFRLMYEAETGRAVHPWWDAHALLAYRPGWQQFLPLQVGGRAPVDARGMTARIEDLLDRTLRRR